MFQSDLWQSWSRRQPLGCHFGSCRSADSSRPAACCPHRRAKSRHLSRLPYQPPLAVRVAAPASTVRQVSLAGRKRGLIAASDAREGRATASASCGRAPSHRDAQRVSPQQLSLRSYPRSVLPRSGADRHRTVPRTARRSPRWSSRTRGKQTEVSVAAARVAAGWGCSALPPLPPGKMRAPTAGHGARTAAGEMWRLQTPSDPKAHQDASSAQRSVTWLGSC